jgi:hypothetical protein
MDRKVFTYGLGPEYNWLEWDESSSVPVDPPPVVFETLSELITGDWRDDVKERADEDPSYLDCIHSNLRAAVAQVIAERDE